MKSLLQIKTVKKNAESQPQPSNYESVAEGRKGSVLKAKYLYGDLKDDGEAKERAEKAPTNEEVVQAVQKIVSEAVETQRKYKHVLWYTLFVAVYLIVLYLQASTYKSGEVVQTLKHALMPNGKPTITFQSQDEVLDYLTNQIILPSWKDPVCGDGKCEYPWEFPSFGRFGCKADCGVEEQTTKVLVNIQANFVGHPTISARLLSSTARWNMCLDDEERRKRGEPDLCWYQKDQEFEEIQANILETMQLIDGNWYIMVKGDYAGRVSGRVFDITNSTNPEEIELDPEFEKCKIPLTRNPPIAKKRRSLLEVYEENKSKGEGEAAEAVKKEFRRALKEMGQNAPNDFVYNNNIENLQNQLNQFEKELLKKEL